MDQSTTQPRGDFVAFLNRDKQPGDKRPIFEGRLAKPGSEEKFLMVLWAHEYTDPRTGEVKIMFSGEINAVSPDADPAAQVAALNRANGASDQILGNLTIRPRQVVLFPNDFKAEAPHKKRPDLRGGVNFGDGSPVARASVWFDKTRNGQVMLNGATSYPLPGKSEGEMQDAEPELADLIAKGEVTKGMPDKKKGRGRE